ncbi:hypothetical protein R3W88_029386 [Solanum pinnatisectum]|uniref:Uncharacterized protein n=1 Tax=Solanum pinnatisectum TaxID=50273 RepID=A0AAV9K558_9SOLN|nr:hypothetical protein R3W88_029386 [Solanum pinnatisectum]
MTVAEFVVAGGDYMGVWEETPKSWYWKSFSKTIVPIMLRRNGSYDDMIASVIKADELACEPSNLVINYQMNGRGKIHPTLIGMPILRINIIVRSPIEPTNSFNDNDLVEYENLGDQPKERFCDQSNDNLGDDSMNRYDHSVNVEDQPVDAKDFEHFEEVEHFKVQGE